MDELTSFQKLVLGDARAQKLLLEARAEKQRLRIAKRRSTTKQWQARLNRCSAEKREYYILVTKDTKCKDD